jgi:phosphatidate cytidylyltransferase
MAFNLQTFKTRALTAIVFVIVMLAGLLWNEWSFLILFSVIHFGCWFEYQKLASLIDERYSTIALLQRYGAPLAGWGFMLSATSEDIVIGDISLHDIGVIISLIGFSLLLLNLIKKFTTDNGRNLVYSLIGLLYISVPWSCMIALRMYDYDFKAIYSSFNPSFYIPIILIASIWINDTMAYIVGSFVGKTPFSKISPKKTWEGTVGGAILCVITVTLAGYYLLKFKNLPSLIVISAIAAVIGTAGDLLESKLKRMANVKDSGQLMPGHGGFLDRFDSLILATPFVWLYVFFFMVQHPNWH